MVAPAQIKDKGHSLLSPSGAHRWMRCPGAPYLEATLEDIPSVPAEEGSVAHFIGEETYPVGDADCALGKTVKSPAGMEFTVDQEMVDAVNMYLGAIQEGETELRVQAEIEKNFEIRENLSGTADAVLINLEENAGKVYDLKYGQGVEVFPEWNEQEMIYLMGALKGANAPADFELELCIVQPRIYSEQKVKSWFTNYGTINAWYEFELLPAFERASAPNEIYVPGEIQCRFCRASRQGACPALKTAAIGTAEIVSYPFPKDVKCLSMEELSVILQHRGAFKNWTKSILSLLDEAEDRAKELIKTGYTVPEMKLVAGRRSAAKWTDEAKARELAEQYGINPNKDGTKTPAQMKTAFKEAGKSPALLDKLCKADRGELVVPVGDKRKALPITADALFNEEN